MKLTEPQADAFIAEFYPPSPYNREIEADTLNRARHATAGLEAILAQLKKQ